MSKIVFVYTQKHFKTLIENYRLKSPWSGSQCELIFINDRLDKSLLNRIICTPFWLRKLRLIFRNIVLEDTVIVFSNAEGLLLNNIDRLIDLRHSRVVLLQHGYFNIEEIINIRSRLKVAIDSFLKTFIGYTPFGAFFGQVKDVDYHVFGKDYEYFLMELGHVSSRVQTSYGSFIKSDLSCYVDYEEHSCVFYDQVLSSLVEFSEQQEELIYHRILHKLLSRYRIVYLKLHPKRVRLPKIMNLDGIKVIGQEDFEKITCRMDSVSFFSTALIEAYALGNPIMPLKIPGLSDSYWGHFTSACEIDEIDSYQVMTCRVQKGQIEF